MPYPAPWPQRSCKEKPTPKKIRPSRPRRASSTFRIETCSLNDSLWSGPERYRCINPDFAADELIKVKLHRNVTTEATGSQTPKPAAATGHARDQKLRRLRRSSD